MNKEEESTQNPTITEENSKENCAVKSTTKEEDVKSNPKPTDEENQEKLSRVVTPALTSFPATFDSANIDENEMKDVDLYEDEDQAEESGNSKEEPANQMAHNANQFRTKFDEQKEENAPKNSDAAVQQRQKSEEFESLSSISNSQLGQTFVIHSSEESAEETFERLKRACTDGTHSYKDIIESLFNTLVGGPFDLESKYLIDNPQNIDKMLELIELCPSNIQAEIWSIFIAIVKKSFLNLEKASKADLISKLLELLPKAESMIVDLLTQLLTVLTSYSISVKEFKLFLRSLQASEGNWKRNSTKLLNVMREMPKREGSDVFFLFPGKAAAGIFVPPLTRWPQTTGWTFSTWFRMDPLNSIYFEREKPYLFSFSTPKGLGYFAYFMGGCLVLRCLRAPGKEVIRCIKHELLPRRWYHIALSFVYSRWAKGEIHCFIDGCLVEVIDANWQFTTNEHFNHCYIGCCAESDPSEAFSGQMAAVYVFSQSISAQQAACLHFLGPSYQSQFKHEAESRLPDSYKKLIFDGKLNESLVFSYCPKDCHGQLVLSHLSSTSTTAANSFFVQIPHAIMKNGVEVVTTHSIHNSLQSVGGIQMLLPLFSQIDLAQEDGADDIWLII